MADCAELVDGIAAHDSGADVVATTLSGYLPGTTPSEGPDLELVATLRAEIPDAVIVAEGRYHTPGLASAALAAGANAVVVGTAVTDPVWITASFVRCLSGEPEC